MDHLCSRARGPIGPSRRLPACPGCPRTRHGGHQVLESATRPRVFARLGVAAVTVPERVLRTSSTPRARLQEGDPALTLRPGEPAHGGHPLGVTPPVGPLLYVPSALLLAVALFGVTALPRSTLARGQRASSTATPTVIIAETRAPATKVSSLDRAYLSTTIANPGEERLHNLTVELTVGRPGAQPVLQARQRAIALDAHNARAVYWAWRVPAQVPPGVYEARVRVIEADGRVLASTGASAPTFEVQERSG